MPPRLKQKPPGEEIRLNNLLAILRRKVRAFWPVETKAADPIGFVFNATEVAILKRLAKGEHVPNVSMTQEEAKEELAWMRRGGRYPDFVYDEDA